MEYIVNHLQTDSQNKRTYRLTSTYATTGDATYHPHCPKSYIYHRRSNPYLNKVGDKKPQCSPSTEVSPMRHRRVKTLPVSLTNLAVRNRPIRRNRWLLIELSVPDLMHTGLPGASLYLCVWGRPFFSVSYLPKRDIQNVRQILDFLLSPQYPHVK